jgi:hypothetical protein
MNTADRKKTNMNEIKPTTLEKAFDMDDAEFEQTVILRYFESQPDNSASEEELETAVKWARTAMMDAVLLDGILRGYMRLRSQNGDVAFQLAEPETPPLS